MSKNDKEEAAFRMQAIADIYNSKRIYSTSIEKYKIALSLAKSNFRKFTISNNIANAYDSMRKYSKALLYYKKTMGYANLISGAKKMNISKTRIEVLFIVMKEMGVLAK